MNKSILDLNEVRFSAFDFGKTHRGLLTKSTFLKLWGQLSSFIGELAVLVLACENYVGDPSSLIFEFYKSRVCILGFSYVETGAAITPAFMHLMIHLSWLLMIWGITIKQSLSPSFKKPSMQWCLDESYLVIYGYSYSKHSWGVFNSKNTAILNKFYKNSYNVLSSLNSMSRSITCSFKFYMTWLISESFNSKES